MLKKIYSVSMLLLLCWTVVQASHFSHVVFFGDSLSDIGNNTWVSVPGRTVPFIQGATITNVSETAHRPIIWLQYLAEKKIFSQATLIASRYWCGEDLQKTSMDFADLTHNHQTVGKNTLYVVWAGGNDIFDNIGRFEYMY
jgi:phospholipase/lecithinase/hemolysin